MQKEKQQLDSETVATAESSEDVQAYSVDDAGQLEDGTCKPGFHWDPAQNICVPN